MVQPPCPGMPSSRAGVSEKIVSVAIVSSRLGTLAPGNRDLKCRRMGRRVSAWYHWVVHLIVSLILAGGIQPKCGLSSWKSGLWGSLDLGLYTISSELNAARDVWMRSKWEASRSHWSSSVLLWVTWGIRDVCGVSTSVSYELGSQGWSEVIITWGRDAISLSVGGRMGMYTKPWRADKGMV